jgi:hypothetical protein
MFIVGGLGFLAWGITGAVVLGVTTFVVWGWILARAAGRRAGINYSDTPTKDGGGGTPPE